MDQTSGRTEGVVPEQPKDESKAIGGYARAESLTPEEREEIARKAAQARWVPKATHEGHFYIGPTKIFAAVLPDGKRVLSQGTFLKAIGRSRSPKAGTGVQTTVEGTPVFLQADILQPFVDDELRVSTAPVFFMTKSGQKKAGYDAQLLPMVAEVYLKLRDACARDRKPVPKQYVHLVNACDVVMRGLARVGIAALIDEATGYQEVRDRRALQEILDKYLLKEHAAWAKRFPDRFYKEIFRLRKWEWKGMKVNRPQCVAHYTTDLVYSRLLPGIVTELEARNPKDEHGTRKLAHHQFFTEDIGHPALGQHIDNVVKIMQGYDEWQPMMKHMNRAMPKQNQEVTPLFDGLDDDA
jgi:hypothetical protein